MALWGWAPSAVSYQPPGIWSHLSVLCSQQRHCVLENTWPKLLLEVTQSNKAVHTRWLLWPAACPFSKGWTVLQQDQALCGCINIFC